MYSAFGVDHGVVSKRMRFVKETLTSRGPILEHTVLRSRPNGIFTNAKVKATTESRHIAAKKGKKHSNTIGGGLNTRGKYAVGGAAGLTVGGAGGAIGHKKSKEVSKAGFRLPGSSAFRGGGAQTGGGQGVSAGLMKPQKPTFQGGPSKPTGGGAAGAFAGGPKKPQQPKGPMQAFAAARQKRMGMQKKPGAGLSSAPSAGFGASKPSFGSGGSSFGQSR
jgi:hypothetical protein